MMAAVTVFSGPQPYIPKFSIDNNQAQNFYDDAQHQLLAINGCTIARTDMANGNHFIALLGGIAHAQPPVPLLFNSVQSLYKSHCSSVTS
jgi:hypothetical protein